MAIYGLYCKWGVALLLTWDGPPTMGIVGSEGMSRDHPPDVDRIAGELRFP